MAYIFKGRLCGYICEECPEPLAGVKVRLYRSREAQNVTALAVAQPKDTFAPLTDEQITDKEKALLAETEVGEDGSFTFTLGENEHYAGEAFEVDLYCGTVPHLKVGPRPPRPRQFTLTTLQPMWRQVENDYLWGWEWCLPERIWCAIRALFGAWVICGRVVDCQDKRPVPNVRVSAMDADWITDDPLGSAITDANGKFRIDYITADFHKTFLSPIINVETPFPPFDSGPDVYFLVHTLSNVPLLTEGRPQGHQPGRENVGHCLCVELCLQHTDVPPPSEAPPAFTHIGWYNILSGINSTLAGNGRTTSDGRAFYAEMPLKGILSRKLETGELMEYRFEFAEAITGQPESAWNWQPVTQALIGQTIIGNLTYWNPDWNNPASPTFGNYSLSVPYYVNGPSGEKNAVISVDGWIKAPQEADFYNSAVGFFTANGYLIQLLSAQLVNYGTIDCTGLTAGQSVTSGGRPAANDRYFGIRMRVRAQGTVGAGTLAGWCHNVAIMNTPYTQIAHHSTWNPYTQASALAVAMVDIQQLHPAGCGQITTDLDVLYTAAHPNIGSVVIWMHGPGGVYNFAPIASGNPDTHGTAVPGTGPGGGTWTVSGLPPCAYVVHLRVQVLLTTGENIPDYLYDEIAFCK